MKKSVDLEQIMNVYKAVLTVEILLVVLNCLRVLLVEFIFIVKKSTIDVIMLKKARFLLFLGVSTTWWMAVMIFLGEKILYGFFTMYFVNFMFRLGILLLIISVLSVIMIIVAWGRDIQGQSGIYIFKKLTWTCYIAALILWLLSWVHLHYV